ncbi:MAG: adenine phosphoribosyltransferase [Deltaproteobacteria bacterium]|nr:adenine phosphoribosyltransferase [Deltaproteobacteria bacterium]
MAHAGMMPYNGEEYFDLKLGNINRRLPLVKINRTTWIASFVMLGDVRLIEHCAELILQKVRPGFDIVAVPEAKAIPLAHSVARLAGGSEYNIPYCVFRKSQKVYMQGELSAPVTSITTAHQQRLYLDSLDAGKMRGARVLFVDDVISTGSTLAACAGLVRLAGGLLHQTAAALIEGGAEPDKLRAHAQYTLVHLAAIPVFYGPESAA